MKRNVDMNSNFQYSEEPNSARANDTDAPLFTHLASASITKPDEILRRIHTSVLHLQGISVQMWAYEVQKWR
jgi:hypothetical protein